jgi:hypothetical protein
MYGRGQDMVCNHTNVESGPAVEKRNQIKLILFSKKPKDLWDYNNMKVESKRLNPQSIELQ